ncbi:unnamed protein product [Vitrella brassicaformis CCMP3155]|uniref:Vacuolar membrane protein n=1 Tax=Vitrella brassicaformis (strain CCMP3155) TaxID=1169540 RepID=A0A0G4G376_VITBC|nr:unnamed protein product [Vitrella brassicaformis CCMP3155]|eukprot:CEM22556.1 unnamed protein product [Vitrella brassicaformis CCMP3155]
MATSERCELLGRFGSFGWWVQGLLGLISFSSLIIKRQRERVKRSWLVFGLDSSKQAAGALTLHLLNLLFAEGLSGLARQPHHDPCNWYWVNIMVDTTLGVLVTYLLLQQARKLLHLSGDREFGNYVRQDVPSDLFVHGRAAPDEHSLSPRRGLVGGEARGEGGGPSLLSSVDWRKWLRQLGLWEAIVVAMKMLMLMLMLAASAPLGWLADTLLSPLDGLPKGKLVVVMVLTPLIMNAFQYWVTDNFIKRQEREVAPLYYETESASAMPFDRPPSQPNVASGPPTPTRESELPQYFHATRGDERRDDS